MAGAKIKVRALKPGFHGVKRRYAGEVFVMEDVTIKSGAVIGKNGKPISWVVPTDEELAEKKARGGRETNSTTNDTPGGQDDPGAP
ncbi:hypothetical protein [Paraburkholderia sp. SIMBA_027]|uniref:hypothetical protein n=1 Tax=Paraburkholderia sp. SIMBA_027 TaxID=3085770 RepID=UPI0039789941